jgi:hypothetical protein
MILGCAMGFALWTAAGMLVIAGLWELALLVMLGMATLYWRRSDRPLY